MAKTYYERLDVVQDATAEKIEQAFRTRLKEIHPDVSDDPEAGERTKDLIEARDVLTDDAERARYDRLGHERYVRFHDSVVESDGEDVAGASSSARGPTGREQRQDGARGSGRGWNGRHRGGGASGTDRAGRSSRTGQSDRADRRAQNEQTRAAWNTAGDEQSWRAENTTKTATEWHAWNTGATHRVYPTDRSSLGSRLFPPGPSLILLATAFVIYPVMLWAALTPAFPLAINVTVGLCLLLVVAFFQSMPSVGIAVFGIWTVLLPVVVWAVGGVPLLSPVWLAALGGTALPLGFSGLTYVALRH